MTARGALEYRVHALLRNLAAGARLALFLRVRAHDYRVSALDFALLLACIFVVWLLAGALRHGLAGELNPQAIPAYLAAVPLLLAAAMLVAAVYSQPDRLLTVALVLCASDPVFELVGIGLPYLVVITRSGAPLYILYLAWIWIVSVRAVAVSMGTRRPHILLGALVVTAMLAAAQLLVPPIDAWRPAQTEDEAEAAPLVGEQLFHAQGQLIERALAAVAPGTPGKPELYFVGFAPDASQDVFLNEMRFVRRLFDERFGTRGRSIVLASSYDALDQLPIGSVTNLGRALERMGRAMNRDEDVLFLFLSAHGDAEHYLSASQPPLELTELNPTALARMLQDAAIKYRVIVVSACYSGGFIEPLRDPNSLIITASAADRTSFGCEAGREFTYFGQAYFRDALAKTRSFTEAFDIARGIVARQEAGEKLESSQPQMHLGAEMRGKLQSFP